MGREESPTSTININFEGFVCLNSSIRFFKIILISISRHQFFRKVIKIIQSQSSCALIVQSSHWISRHILSTCQTTLEYVQFITWLCRHNNFLL